MKYSIIITVLTFLMIKSTISNSTLREAKRRSFHTKGPCNLAFQEDGNLERKMFGNIGTQLDMMHVARIIHTLEFSSETYGCTGAMFTYKALITTASCLTYKGWPKDKTVYFKVFLGSIYIYEATFIYYPNDIKAVVAHPDFNVDTRANDIGMMVFYYDVPNKDRKYIQPMALARDIPDKLEELVVWSNGHARNDSYNMIPKCLIYGVFKVLHPAECHDQTPEGIPLTGKICMNSQVPSDAGPKKRTKTQFEEDFGAPAYPRINNVKVHEVMALYSGVKFSTPEKVKNEPMSLFTLVPIFNKWIDSMTSKYEIYDY